MYIKFGQSSKLCHYTVPRQNVLRQNVWKQNARGQNILGTKGQQIRRDKTPGDKASREKRPLGQKVHGDKASGEKHPFAILFNTHSR